MKIILSLIIFISLNIQLTFSQNVIPLNFNFNLAPKDSIPSPIITPKKCSKCPEWARGMSQYDWAEWKWNDKYEKEHLVLMNSLSVEARAYEESQTQFKIGVVSVMVGSLIEIFALSYELSDYHSIYENRPYIEPLLFSGFTLMAIGGVVLVVSF